MPSVSLRSNQFSSDLKRDHDPQMNFERETYRGRHVDRSPRKTVCLQALVSGLTSISIFLKSGLSKVFTADTGVKGAFRETLVDKFNSYSS
jgi:hypothetical protein